MQSRFVATLLLALTTAAIAEGPTAQDRFDESVGYAYGYALMASRMGEKCVELYPETSTSIREGLRGWKSQNAEALAEIALQWDAYTERDSSTAHLPRSSYSAALERQVPGAIARTFSALGGFRSTGARDRCVTHSLMLLNDPTFHLKAKLAAELQTFRSCESLGTCPNLRRTP